MQTRYATFKSFEISQGRGTREKVSPSEITELILIPYDLRIINRQSSPTANITRIAFDRADKLDFDVIT